MIVTNLGAEPIQPPWKPSAWVVTDGAKEWYSAWNWEWRNQTGTAYPQPSIAPSETKGWTWINYPLAKGEWVKAIEWYYKDKVYHQDLPKPNMSLREYNYVNCD
jgi:hypothetical protein